MTEDRYHTLACGCKLLASDDIREYMKRLIEHVKQCEEAQQIIVEKCQKIEVTDD